MCFIDEIIGFTKSNEKQFSELYGCLNFLVLKIKIECIKKEHFPRRLHHNKGTEKENKTSNQHLLCPMTSLWKICNVYLIDFPLFFSWVRNNEKPFHSTMYRNNNLLLLFLYFVIFAWIFF